MSLLYTIAAFAVTLGILIVIHEFGHYLVAKAAGVKILRFSVGFGRPLISKRFGPDGTEWALAAFPLGGYVKMLDEREGEVRPDEVHRAFNRQPVSRRFAIVAAGPLANFLLAIVLYWVLFMVGVQGVRPILGEVPQGTPAAAARFARGETIVKVGDRAVSAWTDVRWVLLKRAVQRGTVQVELKDANGHLALRTLSLDELKPDDLEGDFLRKLGLTPYQPLIEPRVGRVMPQGAAGRAGLQPGDRVLAVNGQPAANWEGFVQTVRGAPGQPLRVEVSRAGARVMLDVLPDSVEENGQRVGKIGAAPQVDAELLKGLLTEIRYPPPRAFTEALAKTWDTSVFSLKMLGKMVVGQVSWRNISGPITIADYAGQSAQMGGVAFFTFLALISISLGVLNLLPIPLLDGGHLMYYIVEVLKGSPVSEKTMAVGQQLGIGLLLALMTFALFNDINRLIAG